MTDAAMCERSALRQPARHVEVDPEIAKQILLYFVRNPQAADSLEGIARWRLLEERLSRTVKQTEEVVKWLVSEGYLQEIEPTGCTKLYRLDPRRQDQAVRFLAGTKSAKRNTSRTQ
jgi:hypothetical protein